MVKQGPPPDAEERDPAPFLRPTLEMQRQDQSAPYDGKKCCWVPDEKEGFLPGEIKSAKGDTVTVTYKEGVSTGPSVNVVLLTWWTLFAAPLKPVRNFQPLIWRLLFVL